MKVVENLAIVDLGSNSARMAVTEISPDGKFREIKRVKENTRLSEGMGHEKILQPGNGTHNPGNQAL